MQTNILENSATPHKKISKISISNGRIKRVWYLKRNCDKDIVERVLPESLNDNWSLQQQLLKEKCYKRKKGIANNLETLTAIGR